VILSDKKGHTINRGRALFSLFFISLSLLHNLFSILYSCNDLSFLFLYSEIRITFCKINHVYIFVRLTPAGVSFLLYVKINTDGIDQDPCG